MGAPRTGSTSTSSPESKVDFSRLLQIYLDLEWPTPCTTDSQRFIFRSEDAPQTLEHYYELASFLFTPGDNKTNRFKYAFLCSGKNEKEDILFRFEQAKKILIELKRLNFNKPDPTIHLVLINDMVLLINLGLEWPEAYQQAHYNISNIKVAFLRQKIISDLALQPFYNFQFKLALQDEELQQKISTLTVTQYLKCKLIPSLSKEAAGKYSEVLAKETVLQKELHELYKRKAAELQANPDDAIRQLRLFSPKSRAKDFKFNSVSVTFGTPTPFGKS